jgi:hypothetical protein
VWDYGKETMNHLQTLKEFNAWRRSDDAVDQPDPKAIGEAIDWAIRVCEAAENLMDAPTPYQAVIAEDKLFETLE